MPAKTVFHYFKKGLELLNCKQLRMVAEPISGIQKGALKSFCRYLKSFVIQEFRISTLRVCPILKSPTLGDPPVRAEKGSPETEMVIVHLNIEMVLNASKYFWR